MTHTRLAVMVMALLGGAAGAHADALPPLTPEQSSGLARSIRLWTLGLVSEVGGFTVTPADGHYDVAIPLPHGPGPMGFSLDGGPITARAMPGDDGRWHFDAIALPSPLHARHDQDSVGTVTMQDQHGSANIDPTLAGRSSSETTRTGIKLQGGMAKAASVITIAKSASHQEWVPSSPGRVDIASVTQADDLLLHAAPGDDADAPDDGVAIHGVTATLQASDADPDRVAKLLPQLLALAAGLQPDKSELTPQQRRALHELLAQSHDLARGTTQSLEAVGIAVNLGGHNVTLDRVAISNAATTPGGKLDTKTRLDIAGLGLGLPPGAIHDLVPHHLVLASSVTGQSLDDAYAMADQAIDDHAPDALADSARRRLADAPVTVALDQLAFDVGPAAITAKGQLVTRGPGASDGGAVIEATGLDALMKIALADPLLSQAVPVLIFLKGVGEERDGKVVWTLAYKDSKLTVNGTDLSALIPGK